jgi:hypothetical protein
MVAEQDERPENPWGPDGLEPAEDEIVIPTDFFANTTRCFGETMEEFNETKRKRRNEEDAARLERMLFASAAHSVTVVS